MKKSILKNLLALTFALGALVFVAGNVYGGENPNEDDIGDGGTLPPFELRCTANIGNMNNNICWKKVIDGSNPPCVWTGNMNDRCSW